LNLNWHYYSQMSADFRILLVQRILKYVNADMARRLTEQSNHKQRAESISYHHTINAFRIWSEASGYLLKRISMTTALQTDKEISNLMPEVVFSSSSGVALEIE